MTRSEVNIVFFFGRKGVFSRTTSCITEPILSFNSDGGVGRTGGQLGFTLLMWYILYLANVYT